MPEEIKNTAIGPMMFPKSFIVHEQIYGLGPGFPGAGGFDPDDFHPVATAELYEP